MPAQTSLPKWLLCFDEDDSRDFVMHCHWPRMLIEFVGNEGRVVMAIDSDREVIELELAAGREPALLMARLMREAGDFFVEQMKRAD